MHLVDHIFILRVFVLGNLTSDCALVFFVTVVRREANCSTCW